MSPKVLLRSSVAADFDMMKARAAIAVVCKKLRRSALMLLGTQASCRSIARSVVRFVRETSASGRTGYLDRVRS